MAATISDIPTRATANLGKADWEKKLIRVLRSRHYQQRTEQTYRQQAWRLAREMGHRNGTERVSVPHSDADGTLTRSAPVEAGRLAQLNKKVTPHTLWCAFAPHPLEIGTDIRSLQELLGHKNVTTTQIYTHVMAKPGLGVRSPLDG